MAIYKDDISAVASIPGKPTMLDHVLLAASTSGAEDELRGLAEWIRTAYLGGRELAECSSASADGTVEITALAHFRWWVGRVVGRCRVSG
jgi:hypothetical protein